jgi:hypothetical protein
MMFQNTVVRSPQRPYPENITYICISPTLKEAPQLRHGEVIYILKGKLLALGGRGVYRGCRGDYPLALS